eukprot:TRINITY_DN67059_c5_g5_i1.p1 TRINITY_DN67059_c5_g5~~TRINITY_DN67059_c5_g5_i1.p1  ORF type:complete len:811 (+),score=73.91 TRINITY_DN67059_c5_g5_i1:160-2433(+)
MAQWQRANPANRGAPPKHPSEVPGLPPDISDESITTFNTVHRQIHRTVRDTEQGGWPESARSPKSAAMYTPSTRLVRSGSEHDISSMRRSAFSNLNAASPPTSPPSSTAVSRQAATFHSPTAVSPQHPNPRNDARWQTPTRVTSPTLTLQKSPTSGEQHSVVLRSPRGGITVADDSKGADSPNSNRKVRMTINLRLKGGQPVGVSVASGRRGEAEAMAGTASSPTATATVRGGSPSANNARSPLRPRVAQYTLPTQYNKSSSSASSASSTTSTKTTVHHSQQAQSSASSVASSSYVGGVVSSPGTVTTTTMGSPRAAVGLEGIAMPPGSPAINLPASPSAQRSLSPGAAVTPTAAGATAQMSPSASAALNSPRTPTQGSSSMLHTSTSSVNISTSGATNLTHTPTTPRHGSYEGATITNSTSSTAVNALGGMPPPPAQGSSTAEFLQNYERKLPPSPSQPNIAAAVPPNSALPTVPLSPSASSPNLATRHSTPPPGAQQPPMSLMYPSRGLPPPPKSASSNDIASLAAVAAAGGQPTTALPPTAIGGTHLAGNTLGQSSSSSMIHMSTTAQQKTVSSPTAAAMPTTKLPGGAHMITVPPSGGFLQPVQPAPLGFGHREPPPAYSTVVGMDKMRSPTFSGNSGVPPAMAQESGSRTPFLESPALQAPIPRGAASPPPQLPKRPAGTPTGGFSSPSPSYTSTSYDNCTRLPSPTERELELLLSGSTPTPTPFAQPANFYGSLYQAQPTPVETREKRHSF